MKLSIASTLVAVALMTSMTVHAKSSEGQMLSQCKTAINAQFEDVNKIRLVNLKTRKNTFTAKLRVISEADRAMYTCTINGDEQPQLARVDRKNTQVAAGE
ncbi:MAG: hypothetical protein AAF431_13750 [Pseudomonadota bacterium]